MFKNGQDVDPVTLTVSNSSIRPQGLPKGSQIFDEILGKPIWLKTVNTDFFTSAKRFSNTTYSGVVSIVDDGYVCRSSGAGTTGGAKSTFPKTAGATVAEGTITWSCEGVAAVCVDAIGTAI